MKTFVSQCAGRIGAPMLCLTMLMVVSCQQDRMEPQLTEQKVAPGVTLASGRMMFATLNDLKTTIDRLKKMSESQRTEWSRNLKFVSLQDFYQENEGIVQNSINPVYQTKSGNVPYVPDVLFARVLNKDGIYQVGKEVHRIVLGGKELATDEQHADQLLMETKGPDVESHSITIEQMVGPAPNNPNARQLGFELPVYAKDYDGDHKVFGVFSKTSSFFYQSYAFKLQAREWGGWWMFAGWRDHTAKILDIQDAGFSGTAFPSGTVYAGSGSGSCTDCSEAYAFLAEFYGPLMLNNFTVHGKLRFQYNDNGDFSSVENPTF